VTRPLNLLPIRECSAMMELPDSGRAVRQILGYSIHIDSEIVLRNATIRPHL
jgi:hypothetical protein